LNGARSRARRYGGSDLGRRGHEEGCGNAIKGNARRTRQVRPKNLDTCSHFAGRGYGFDEGAKTGIQLENCALIFGAAELGYPIQIAVRPLGRPGKWEGAVRLVEVVQRCHRTLRGRFEDGAIAIGAAFDRGSVEVAVRTQKQQVRSTAIGPLSCSRRLGPRLREPGRESNAMLRQQSA
jgi:hypothetical protein